MVALFSQTASGGEPEKITFADHVLPIFRNSCLNCHNPEKHKGGLDLSTYQAAMAGNEDGKVIEPGSVENSLLVKLIAHTDEPAMPPKSDKLPDSEIELIKKWIEGNALETADSKAPAKSAADAAPFIAAAPEDNAAGGPPPMPRDLLLEPVVRTARAGAIASMAASPRAPLLAVAGQRQVLLFNTETLELAGVLAFPEGFPEVVKFSRDGRLVLAGGGVGAKSGRVVIWDVETGERVREAGDEFDAVLAADISADHEIIALGGPGKLVKLYSARDGRLLHSMKKHTDWVTAIAFTPDGKLLVTGDRAGNLAVWETDGARELFALTGHKGAITSVACGAGMAVSASEDGTLKVWDLKEGKLTKSWEAHKGGALSVAFARDGRLVSCGRDKVARLWDGAGRQVRASEAFSDVALQAAWCGSRFFAGDWTGVIRAWNAADGKRAGEITSNPPTLAERADAVAERIAEIQPRQEKLLAQRALVETAADAARATEHAADLAATACEARLHAAEARLATAKTALDESGSALEKARLELAQSATGSKDSGGAADEENGGSAEAAAGQETKEAEEENAKRGTAAETARAELAEADAALKSAQSELAAANSTRKTRQLDAQAAAARFNQAAGEAAQASEQLAAAKREAAKWRAAQLNVKLHAARQAMREGESIRDKAVAEANARLDELKAQTEKLAREYESLQREAAAGVAEVVLQKQ